MNSVILSFSIAGIMLVIGMLLRAKIGFLQNILMPASVIGGIIGFILINLLGKRQNYITTSDFSMIVDTFFVFSFIGIGLNNKSNNDGLTKEEKKKLTKAEKKARKKNTVFRGAVSLGLVWCAVYGMQAFVGGLFGLLFEKVFHMDALYWVLLSFGFCQGPGQASTYGQIFEHTYGLAGAEMVGIAFAVCGFLVAFLVGVPLAKLGIQKNITNKKGALKDSEKRGFYHENEERESLGKETTYGGNIETIATHFAFMGIAYVIALGFSWLARFIPGIGESFAEMKFFWGMLAGTILRKVLGRLQIEYLLDDLLLSRMTAFFTDYVVVTAFMSVEITMLGTMFIPILLGSTVCTMFTLVMCIFFCQRLGSNYDFEKLLGVFGTATGTASSGISLIRIVDPMLQTPAAREVGCINIVGILAAPIVTLATFVGIGQLSMVAALVGFAVSTIIDIVILIAMGALGKEKTFTFAI